MKRLIAAASLLGLASASLFAAGPALNKIEPRGAQRGTAVALTLTGFGLTDEAEVLSEIPGALTKLTPERSGRELSYLLELQADAPVGSYPIRVETAEGISNLLLFTVGPYREVLEYESEAYMQEYSNDSPESAEAAKHPVTINGTLRGADRDVYRFQGTAGEAIVFEVEARRIGSAIDPVLEVRDAEGELIARNNDAATIGVDARAEVTFPRDGDYYVRVSEARFSAQRENFYRLKAGSYRYAEGLFPLGWKRGEDVEIELFGGNLPQPVKVRPDLSAEATRSGYAMVALPEGSATLPLPLFVSDGPEVLESAGSGPRWLEPAVVVNGRISKPGEVDRYRIKVKPGEAWMIETEAARLDTSALYGLITISDAQGKKLASAGDQEPEEPLSFISSTGETFGDPHLAFQVPEGEEEILLTVEDLLGRGGPEYAYRLVAHRQPADFTLTLLTPYVNIPERGSALISVNVARRGYGGAVQLTIPDLPEDLIVRGGHIPAEVGGMTTSRRSRRGALTITPKPGAEQRRLALTVQGEGRLENGELIRRTAPAPGMMTAVRGTKQKPATAPWLDAYVPARVSEPEAAVLEVLTPLRVRLIQGMEHDIRWSFAGRSGGARPVDRVQVSNTPAVGNIRVIGGERNEKGAKSGELTMVTTMGTSPMTFDLLLSTKVRINGREKTIYAPAITFEVVQGYDIESPGEPVRLSRGRATEIVGKFHREPEFLSPVTVKADNLPLDIRCDAAEISRDPNEYRLSCEAGASAKPGEYEIELVASSVLAGRDKELVPYKIPPVTARLVVAGSGKLATAR